ncbi:MAG: hypothetical protein QNJ34_20680 [Xenococcaceae cyanobacterium MO_188.B29]|nr:hypothetical protein [Xenococcaceae cyanobacterium MO_188.B29]
MRVLNFFNWLCLERRRQAHRGRRKTIEEATPKWQIEDKPFPQASEHQFHA